MKKNLTEKLLVTLALNELKTGDLGAERFPAGQHGWIGETQVQRVTLSQNKRQRTTEEDTRCGPLAYTRVCTYVHTHINSKGAHLMSMYLTPCSFSCCLLFGCCSFAISFSYSEDPFPESPMLCFLFFSKVSWRNSLMSQIRQWQPASLILRGAAMWTLKQRLRHHGLWISLSPAVRIGQL